MNVMPSRPGKFIRTANQVEHAHVRRWFIRLVNLSAVEILGLVRCLIAVCMLSYLHAMSHVCSPSFAVLQTNL
jgi:hypothetical protein